MRRGFTLIELVLVIAILGILATISAYTFSSLSAKSRDNTRKADIERLRGVLQQYYLDNRQYPNFDASQGHIYAAHWQLADSSSCTHSSSNTARLTPTYISVIPNDPKQNPLVAQDNCVQLQHAQTFRYYYLSFPSANPGGPATPASGFGLMANLERDKIDLVADSSNPLKSTGTMFGDWYTSVDNYNGTGPSAIGADVNYLVTGKSGR